VSIALVLTRASLHEQHATAPDEDNKILVLVLKQANSGKGYTVVSSETTLPHADATDPDEVSQSKKYIREHLKADRVHVSKLVDQLFERNRTPVRLSIKSSRSDGYVIDYEGKFDRYFTKAGGWDQLRKENPSARGMTRVSLPAYDASSGFLLIYTGTQYDWLMGSGWIVLYKYDKGKLQALKKVMLWVS
jgi:hypothetical protein